LSWFSSMWDGCDGEVARLTFRESDFGCWLDGICDDLYYGAVFIGITVGLARSGDRRLAFDLGAVALAGMLIMVAVHYVLRFKVAARTGAATSFANFFEQRMQALGDDPIARFARATYKLGTRSTLPYVLFALALVGQTWLALVIVAVGPHVYWTLSLYLWWAPAGAAPVRPGAPWARASRAPPRE